MPYSTRPLAIHAIVSAALFLAACGENRPKPVASGYVNVPQVTLRDRLAPVYNKVGVVQNGERVEVLEKQRRFARVRTASGQEGWMEQRYLAGQDVYDGFQALARENAEAPAQGQAVAVSEVNMHLLASRDGDVLYRLAEGARVDLLKRATAERPLPKGQAPPPDYKPVFEDWWLVRDQQGRAGWVLARRVDIDLPLEIAQYAEGQRIVAYFVLNEVEDDGRKIPQALLAYTEPKDGLPFDFNQIRVFTWNAKRDRYETAYRERRLHGLLPIRAARERFEKEGELPAFTVRVQDHDGKLQERKYKLNGVIVRQVSSSSPQPS